MSVIFGIDGRRPHADLVRGCLAHVGTIGLRMVHGPEVVPHSPLSVEVETHV